MFRIGAIIKGLTQLFRNIYKFENDYMLGVAESKYELFFFHSPTSPFLPYIGRIPLKRTNTNHDTVLKSFPI